MNLINEIKDHIIDSLNGFELNVSDNHLTFNSVTDLNQYTFSIGFQDFGEYTLLLIQRSEFIFFPLEKQFRNTIIPDLRDYLNPLFTIEADKNVFPLISKLHFKKIEKQESSKLYVYLLKEFLSQAIEGLMSLVTPYENFSKMINDYSFDRRDEIVTGGKFPINIMKKIYLLKQGENELRYHEYKNGLEFLLKRYEEKKPDQKDKVQIFWKGYKHFIDKLNADTAPLLK